MSVDTVKKLVTGDGERLVAPLIFPHGNAALIVLPESVECPTCHRAVRLVINRDGRTLCVSCDDDALQTSARK